jgi:hypothetical protein
MIVQSLLNFGEARHNTISHATNTSIIGLLDATGRDFRVVLPISKTACPTVRECLRLFKTTCDTCLSRIKKWKTISRSRFPADTASKYPFQVDQAHLGGSCQPTMTRGQHAQKILFLLGCDMGRKDERGVCLDGSMDRVWRWKRHVSASARR